MARTLSGLLVAGLLWLATSASAADFFFKDGDVVVMIGDSITEQHLYSNYVEMWSVTRFPQWKLTFRNVGIGGDRSVGGNSRFARDVLVHKPTAMTVDFGMNDGSYRAFGEDTFKPYMAGLQGMADQAKAAKIRTAWMTPQPLDTGDQGTTALTGYNQTLEQFSAGVKTIADKNDGLFVDQFHPYLAVLDKVRGGGAKYERITGGDAVHPGPPGQALMAASILKGLGFPSLVSAVEVDGAAGTLVTAKNCQVEQIAKKEGGLTFNRLDSALPFFPSEASSILAHAPLLEDLNQYSLKVTGLAPGKYVVKLAGEPVGEYSSEQLATGVNLAANALAKGPIAEQVKAVKAAVEAKNRFHHDMIFRGIVLSGTPEWIYSVMPREELEAKKQKVIADRLAKVAELDAVVAKTLIMKPHSVEVLPAK
jgi:lysophospholipase L1-like esterase